MSTRRIRKHIKHCKEINQQVQHDHISLYTSVTTWLAANRSAILTNLHANNFLHRRCCWQYLQIGETRSYDKAKSSLRYACNKLHTQRTASMWHCMQWKHSYLPIEVA